MDLRRLHYFVTIAEEGNVGRAARRLNMSQPPLSQRIRELEADLGCALFVRTSQGMSLTPPGEVLLVEARRLLAGVQEARQRVRRAAGTSVLRVGVLGPGEAALSAGIVETFVSHHPGAEVTLVQGDLGNPTLGLLNGRVDVAITFTPFSEAGLTVRTVREDRCYVAIPSSDPFAHQHSVVRSALADRVSVHLPERTDTLFRAHWQPHDEGEGPLVHSLDECLHAVLWRRAVAFVPEQVVRNHPVEGVSYVLVTDLEPARLVLAWRRGDRSPMLTDYIEAFCAVSQRLRVRAPQPEGQVRAGLLTGSAVRQRDSSDARSANTG